MGESTMNGGFSIAMFYGRRVMVSLTLSNRVHAVGPLFFDS